MFASQGRALKDKRRFVYSNLNEKVPVAAYSQVHIASALLMIFGGIRPGINKAK